MLVSGFVVAMTAAILSTLGFVGDIAIRKLLAREAIRMADLWYYAAVGPAGGLLDDIARRANRGELAHALGIANIDALVALRADGTTEALGGTAETAAADFSDAAPVGGAAADELSPFSRESSAFTNSRLAWLGPNSYRTWVVFPNTEDSGGRIAVRIDQSEAAVTAIATYQREIAFSGGVAVITFVSFMAGFTYRARQLAAENAAIRYIALHDEMTGLPNRKHFEEFMAAALASAEREDRKVALFVLDLDGFKSVNDTLGHPVGDGLLRSAALRLKGSLRGDDLLARLSGDEFAIVVPSFTDPAILAPLAERVLKMLSTPFRVDGHEVQVSASIGLAVAPDNGTDIDMLMRNADFALYRAKSGGRKTWRFFDPKMAQDLASRRTMEDGLRHALENNLFQILYQPQIELGSGRTVGYEAMLRWALPGQGLVPANLFFSIAEETGLVVPIGEWAIAQIARDAALLPGDLRIAINLSATQLKRDGIDRFIVETMRRHNVRPSRIDIEVNEGVLGRDEAACFARIAKLREAGMAVVLDGFGMGTLSLGLLSRHSFDKVKVDRSFLAGDEHRNMAVLVAICSLGRSLDFAVAGQGVESDEQAELLRLAGCSVAQGYYLAAPMPLESLIRRANEETRPETHTLRA